MENSINKWHDLNLDDLRQVMDPDADAAVSSLYKSRAFNSLRDMLKDMARNDTFVPDSMPGGIRDFLTTELQFVPTAEDIAAFERAHRVWRENGVQFIFILFFRSLPYTYMAEKPANVLRMTKILEAHPQRRIFETAQFVFDVSDKEWWTPGKRGLITALKIRLMHAAMRYNLLYNPEGEAWDKEAWGMPISQEDLIATNQVFSLEFIKGMAILGQPLDEEDQNAWFHTWKMIGKIMGIQDNLLCRNKEEAWTLQKAMYNHLFPDDNRAGIALAKALVETLATFLLSTKLILLMMKKMIMDEEHPDLFYRVLGPSFAKEYPSIFKKSRSAEEVEEDAAAEHQEFYDELMAYKEKVKAYREDQKQKDPVSRGEGKKNLVDFQLDVFEELAKKMDPQGPVDRGIVADLFKTAMNSVGGVIIGVLSLYFREGKEAGFRIPTDLKEHWALS